VISRPIKVLVIDEHIEDRVALRQHLLKANDHFRVFEAGSGETALDWFRAVQPDCVVMELQLKDVTGIEVLDRITLEMSKKPLPIFIWTRLSHPILSTTISSFGIRGYFQKNKDSEQALITAILNALDDSL
jgi:DNA-binding NarL/FixJ family response regulator